jgi:large subunit ribosomal protein L13
MALFVIEYNSVECFSLTRLGSKLNISPHRASWSVYYTRRSRAGAIWLSFETSLHTKGANWHMSTKTYMANAQTHQPKWHVIDANGKVLGRVAAEAASILRGKHLPTYTPHVNCGDFVVIINCAKAVLSGNKLEQKEYIRHTGWIGGLKRVKYKDLMATRPEFAMEMAVKGMLPHTRLGKECLKKLRVYAGAEHEHTAQVNANTSAKKAAPAKKAPAAKKPVAEKAIADKPAAAPKAPAKKPAAPKATGAKAPAKKAAPAKPATEKKEAPAKAEKSAVKEEKADE